MNLNFLNNRLVIYDKKKKSPTYFPGCRIVKYTYIYIPHRESIEYSDFAIYGITRTCVIVGSRHTHAVNVMRVGRVNIAFPESFILEVTMLSHTYTTLANGEFIHSLRVSLSLND